ncbi:MAG: succinate dehydrogenase cytochrome b subunit [Bacteroidetes bacterium]|nr:succinate dehydrogenase cytochrome b subunit [Bacteroidota bacterium]
MNFLVKYASITKKVVMALAGLFLILFLLVHLTINLFLLRDDQGAWFNAAAHFMGTNYLVRIFEYILFGGFLIHILMGIILQLKNWMSRPVRYHISNKSTTPFLSKYMIYTGGIVFIFLVIHFINFYFIRLGFIDTVHMENGHPNFYLVAKELFSLPLYTLLYLVLMVGLGFHLYHAFNSAFQTLGLSHTTYTPVIERAGLIYSIIVPLGFSIIPLYFWLII